MLKEIHMSAPEATGPWIDLFVAIYTPKDMIIYKYWALFIADDTNPLVLSVVGRAGTFAFREQGGDPRESIPTKAPELVQVGTVHQYSIPDLRTCAAELPLWRFPGWNCQDYVMDLLMRARDAEVIAIDRARLRYLHGLLDGVSGYLPSP